MAFFVNVMLYLYLYLVNSFHKLLFHTLKVGLFLLFYAINLLVDFAKFVDYETCELIGLSIIILLVLTVAILN